MIGPDAIPINSTIQIVPRQIPIDILLSPNPGRTSTDFDKITWQNGRTRDDRAAVVFANHDLWQKAWISYEYAPSK